MITRFQELDSLRGIAALLVCIYHYTERFDEAYAHYLDGLISFSVGASGVYLFFILSGFVILLSLMKKQHASDFIVSRLSRLYPAYWAAIAVTFSSYIFFHLPSREVSLTTALVNLTMLQAWLDVDHVDGVYWTLSVELLFYTIMLAILLSGQLENIRRICISWLLAISTVCILGTWFGFRIGPDLDLILLLHHGNLFIAGMMFYLFWQEKRLTDIPVILLCLIPEVLLRPETLVMVCIYFSLFFLFVMGRLSWISWKPLVYLGCVSYGLIWYIKISGILSLWNSTSWGSPHPGPLLLFRF